MSLALLGLSTLTAEAQKKGGTLRVGILGEPPSLDVHWTTATITETLGNHIYEGLYTLDAANRPIPMLAESHIGEQGQPHVHLQAPAGRQVS